MKWFDLSHPVDNTTAVYPGDQPVKLVQSRWMARDHYNGFTLSSGMHAGTHVDVPLHLMDHPLTVWEYPLERFTGPGRLLPCPAQGVIEPTAEWEALETGEIPLLVTGWDAHFGRADYFSSHPVLSDKAADFLIERGVGMVVLDTPSPDRSPFPVHKKLLAAGILIVENAADLGALRPYSRFTFQALPLKLPTEASLVRAAAFTEEENG